MTAQAAKTITAVSQNDFPIPFRVSIKACEYAVVSAMDEEITRMIQKRDPPLSHTVSTVRRNVTPTIRNALRKEKNGMS